MRSGQETIRKASQLAESGRHAEVLEYLSEWPRQEIEESSTLSLLFGTAHARLGRNDEGAYWVNLALDRSRQQGDPSVETRALNARGAIAFVSGKIDEAADYFTQGLISASREGNHATIGRCSNNLGIINNLRGRHAEAAASYSMAIAAFERATLPRGAAEAHHNLGITYGEQRALHQALDEAAAAIANARAAGDDNLAAMALRGRAEIRLLLGELEAAEGEIQAALSAHRTLGDPVEEAQDLRIVAGIQAAKGDTASAEESLRDVIARAEMQGRPQLMAEARRDLAHLLRKVGRHEEALGVAKSAIRLFEKLGAEAEVRKLNSHEWGYPLENELRKALEPLHEAQRLANSGQYAELVAYLRGLPYEELEQSPTLALLCGIGYARLGQLDEGWQWIMIALTNARAVGDRAVEVRALNVYGAIALERGGIDEATYFFNRVQAEAMEAGDLSTLGRCANNLGIIANMRGDYAHAVGAYTMALAAYQRAGLDRGVAETHHNLGIVYRDQSDFTEAMRAADNAVEQAERLEDIALQAQALAGRAEIRVASGEPELALREAERAIALHRKLGDQVRETEDLRIFAGALAEVGRTEEAEATLRKVIGRAGEHMRPLLAATARRDLAHLLARDTRLDEAREAGCQARDTFDRLGARVEVEKLDAFLSNIDLVLRVNLD